MSSTSSENKNYWPSNIQYSKSFIGIVIDTNGNVIHANKRCKTQLAKHVDTCDCTAIIFNEVGVRIQPDDLLNREENERIIIPNVRIWIQCAKYCIDFGYQWELSMIQTNGERHMSALASDLVVNDQLKEKCEALSKEKDTLHNTYQSLAEKIPGFVFQFQKKIDGGFSFPFISSGFGKMLGVSAEELEQSADPILRLIHPQDKDKLERSINVSATRLSHWKLTFRFLCPSLEIKWVQGIAVPEQTSESVIWRGFIYDISDRIKYEQRLNQQQSELDEIAFLQAHEFRRPLANMLSLFDMIELQSREEDPVESILELLNMLKKSVKEADAVIAKIVSKTNNSKWLISKRQG